MALSLLAVLTFVESGSKVTSQTLGPKLPLGESGPPDSTCYIAKGGDKGFLKALGNAFVDWSTGGDNDRYRAEMARLEANRDAFFEEERRKKEAKDAAKNGGKRSSNWNPAYGGSDADGNPLTVSFGSGKADRKTLLADGDQSEGDFFNSENHDHFGPGNGPNDNGTRRGKYTGRGS